VIRHRAALRRWAAAPALAIALALVASGCSATRSGYADRTVEAFREQVLTVTQASAAGDWAGASAALDRFVLAVEQALAGGEIDQQRHDAIMAAIDTTKAELAALIAGQQPTPAPSPSDAGNGGNGSGNGNGGNGGGSGNGNGDQGEGKGSGGGNGSGDGNGSDGGSGGNGDDGGSGGDGGDGADGGGGSETPAPTPAPS